MKKPQIVYDESYYKQYESGFINAKRSDHDRILKLVRFEPDHKVLEIGCGYGVLLGKIPHTNKSGIECNQYAVDVCRKRGLKVILNINIETGLDYPDRTFGYVIMNEVIEHLKKPNLVISEVCRILRPGGKFIITTPVKSFLNKDLDPSHFSEFSLKGLAESLTTRGFTVLTQEVNGFAPYNFLMNRTIYKVARIIRKRNANEKSSTVQAVSVIQSLYDKNPLAIALSLFRGFLKGVGTQQLVIAQKL